MAEQDDRDLQDRLRAHLVRVADRPAPAGFERRLMGIATNSREPLWRNRARTFTAGLAIVAVFGGFAAVGLWAHERDRSGESGAAKPPAARSGRTTGFAWPAIHLQFSYPASWQSLNALEVVRPNGSSVQYQAPDISPGPSELMVALGPEAMSWQCTGDRCVPSPQPGGHLRSGGILVTWSSEAVGPGIGTTPVLDKVPGKLTTIGGRRAKIDTQLDPGCAAMGGRQSIDAFIPSGTSANTRDDIWRINACLSGRNDSSLEADVRNMLSSVSFVAPPIPTPGAPSATSTCTSSQLALGWGGAVSEQTGQHSLLLTLTNRSGSSCRLKGYPGLTLVDASGRPIPFEYREGGDAMITSAPPVEVDLNPGATAYLMANQYRCDQGARMQAVSVRVTPPGDDTALSLAWGASPIMAYCGPGDPGSVLDISPIEPAAQAVRP